jgi:hypothetical protein
MTSRCDREARMIGLQLQGGQKKGRERSRRHSVGGAKDTNNLGDIKEHEWKHEVRND